jgi:hypothetical protein
MNAIMIVRALQIAEKAIPRGEYAIASEALDVADSLDRKDMSVVEANRCLDRLSDLLPEVEI